MRVVLHRAGPAAAVILTSLLGSPPAAAELEATANLAAILERARARQLEILATVRTSAHRQHQQQQVRGGRGRVRAEGHAVHSVRPRADGRFELSELERETRGRATELGLSPPMQVQSDPDALTTSEAIAHVLDRPERLRLAGRTTLAGREAWLVELEPQPKHAEPENLKEKVRRASRGRLWVDAESGAVLRLKTELERRVGVLGGKVRRAEVTRDQRPASMGLWVPVAIEMEIEMSILTIERTTATRTTFEGWKLAPALPADGAP